MWNKVKILKNAKSRIDWNKWASGDRNKAIIDAIDKLALPNNIITSSYTHKSVSNEDDEFGLNKEFCLEELQKSIRKLKIKAAPGPDDIENAMIKLLPLEIQEKLLSIFNSLFHKGKIIPEWRVQTVIFIDKPGKKR